MKKRTLTALTLSLALLVPSAMVLADTAPAAPTAPITTPVKKTHGKHKRGAKKNVKPAAAPASTPAAQ